MKTLIKTWNGEFGIKKKVKNHRYLVSNWHKKESEEPPVFGK